MPTTYNDQFYLIDPYAPPPAGTALSAVQLTIIDSNNNGVLNTTDSVRQGGTRIYDQINGSRISGVYNGDTVTVLRNGTQYTITGVTFYTQDGSRYFTPADGSVLHDTTFVGSTWVSGSTQATVGSPGSNLGPPCLVAGTLIATPSGEVPVESLRAGMAVETLDHGPQTLRWVGHGQVPGVGVNAPIRFATGELGNRRDLLVSPQHRMLISGWQPELHFGEREILVAARHLVNGRTIRPAPCASVLYVHLMFDRHEIILAEGAATESFHPGEWLCGPDSDLRRDILRCAPDLRGRLDGWPAARPVARGAEAAVVAA